MSTNASRREDLDEILDAIREVEASLETRQMRANAATGMVWGLVASSIFLFYQWVRSNQEAALDALPLVLVQWGWVLPAIAGYLVTTAIGVRLGRATRDPNATRSIRRLLLVLVVPIAAVTLVGVTGRGTALIPGMWVAFLGVTYLIFPEPESSGARRTGRALALTNGLAGLVLMSVPALYPWANGIAAVWYLVFLFGACAREYYAIGR